MKEKLVTILSFLLLFFPWTIFPIRTNAWALESPAAQILIVSYLLLMLAGAAFSIFCYVRRIARSKFMQICVTIHGIYGFGALCLAGLMCVTAFS